MYPFYTIIRTHCIDYLHKQNIHEEYVEFTSQLTDKMIGVDSQLLDSRILRIREAMKELGATHPQVEVRDMYTLTYEENQVIYLLFLEYCWIAVICFEMMKKWLYR